MYPVGCREEGKRKRVPGGDEGFRWWEWGCGGSGGGGGSISQTLGLLETKTETPRPGPYSCPHRPSSTFKVFLSFIEEDRDWRVTQGPTPRFYTVRTLHDLLTSVDHVVLHLCRSGERESR